LARAGSNGKAVAAAISNISEFEEGLGEKDPTDAIVKIIFANFKTPDERIRIAERLIGTFNGRKDVLRYAAAILARQNSETKGLPRIQLLYATLILKEGYTHTEAFVPRYTNLALDKAEALLRPLVADPNLRDDAMYQMIWMSINRNNLAYPMKFFKQLEAEGPLKPSFQYQKAIVEYTTGQRDAAIETLETLAKQEPGYALSDLLLVVYETKGDFAKSDALQKALVERDPRNAWALGEYSRYLLRRGDVESAIAYGNQALSVMDYPVGRWTTSLAYFVRAAARDKGGNAPGAQADFDRARELGISEDYLKTNCRKNCDDVANLIRKYGSSTGQPKAAGANA
jgi:tetratricopeptide (TPR) repeat protein